MLWIKLFYWMRIFSTLAYFSSLILRTLYDIFAFGVMINIILFAFANYFYILNINAIASGPTPTPEDQTLPGYRYVEEYTNHNAFDALISSYLIMLGEFNTDDYSKGPDHDVAWVFFLLATFLCLVIFMNMMIAIMGNTYSTLLGDWEAVALHEQIKMIEDFKGAVNLKEQFKGYKYIIIASPGEEQ